MKKTLIEVKTRKYTISIIFCNYVDKYHPTQAFRFSQKNVDISQDGAIQYLPLYLLDTILDHEKGIFSNE